MTWSVEPPHGPQRTGSAFALVLAGAALVLTVYVLWDRFGPSARPIATPRPVVARGELPDFERTTIEVYETAAPSVVHITTPEILVRRDMWTATRIPEGTGSGFMWDEAGHIVTNHHVIANHTTTGVLVRLANQEEYRGRVIGWREDLDIAVVKVSGDAPLRPVLVGESVDLRVGQMALAIGNPYGLDQTLTTGVISALDRTIETRFGAEIQGVIQVDAAINPGNSGGPLLDSAGRVIGMNTAITSPTRASAGIGFAVPIDTINRVVPRLITGYELADDRAVLGVQTQRITFRGAEGSVVVVVDVLPGSGAEEAGVRPTRRLPSGELQLGDVIVSIDDKPVDHPGDLHDVLDEREPGDTVEMEVVRGLPWSRQRLTLEITLREAGELR